jgi:hypothetical protein
VESYYPATALASGRRVGNRRGHGTLQVSGQQNEENPNSDFALYENRVTCKGLGSESLKINTQHTPRERFPCTQKNFVGDRKTAREMRTTLLTSNND